MLKNILITILILTSLYPYMFPTKDIECTVSITDSNKVIHSIVGTGVQL